MVRPRCVCISMMLQSYAQQLIHPHSLYFFLGINATASYFGDKVLSKQQVQVIAETVFQNLESNDITGHVPHSQCALYLEIHPMIQQFISGCGQYKYVPSKHDMVKTASNDDEVQKELFVQSGVVRNVNGTATIGASSSSEESREI